MATESIAVAPHQSSRSEVGADGGSRTLTAFRPQDFKSCVSTSSTTSASGALSGALRPRQGNLQDPSGREQCLRLLFRRVVLLCLLLGLWRNLFMLGLERLPVLGAR